MKTSLTLVALVISSLSLALHLRGQKLLPPLEKFLVPARMSELDHRMERADVRLIRDSTLMHNGVAVPFIHEITDDHQHIVVRVLVLEKDLPKAYEERKQTLSETAMLSLADVASEIDLKVSSARNVVIVQFVSIEDLAKNVNTDKTYAEYKGGELTFH